MSRVLMREQVYEPFSVEELAILEFTNEGDSRSNREKIGPISIYTGKDSYYWAVATAIAASQYEHVDEEAIYYALARTFKKFRGSLKLKYANLCFSDHSSNDIDDRELFRDLLKMYLSELGCNGLHFEDVVSRTNHAFDSLIEKQLIEDPLELAAGGALLAVVGLLPYGFTTKTRRGRVVYRKIEAMYWAYEKRVVRGEETTKYVFRLAKYLKAFKRAFVAAAQEELDELDEPDDKS